MVNPITIDTIGIYKFVNSKQEGPKGPAKYQGSSRFLQEDFQDFPILLYII